MSLTKFTRLLIFGLLFQLPITRGSMGAEFDATLLTSIAPGPGIDAGTIARAEAKMGDRFIQIFQAKGYRVKVIPNADASTLGRELADPKLAVLVWVSHGGGETTPQKSLGVNLDPVIVDSQGRDIKAVFQSSPPNLRLLSLIACDSADAIREMQSEGTLSMGPQLKIESYDQPVEGISTFNQRMNEAEKTIPPAGMLLNISKPVTAVRALSFQRFIPPNSDPKRLDDLIVTLGDHFLGVIPKAAPGQSSEGIFQVPMEWLRVSPHPEFIVSSGYGPLHLPESEFGDIRFHLKGADLEWKPESTATGEVLGSNNRIFAGASQSEPCLKGNSTELLQQVQSLKHALLDMGVNLDRTGIQSSASPSTTTLTHDHDEKPVASSSCSKAARDAGFEVCDDPHVQSGDSGSMNR